jgi:hypothetical protein
MAWTTDALVAAVKRKAQAPSAGWPITDAEILQIAFEATTKTYVPAIRAVREDFFTTSEAITLTDGVQAYKLPARASSTTIKQVLYINTASGRAMPVTRLPVSQQWRGIGVRANAPWGYVIEGSYIRFIGIPQGTSQYSVRVYYQRRPSMYVTSDGTASAVVTGVTSTTIAVSGTPTWAGASGTLDAMSPDPEADLLMQDATYARALNVFTILNGVSTANVSVGDYVSLVDTTPVVLLPDAFMHSLIDATTAECLRSMGDYTSAASLDAQVAQDLPRLLASIATRAESQPLPIKNQNAGLYQRNRWYNGGWFQ